MVSPWTAGLLSAVAAGSLAAAGEWLHARRVRRVSVLAFGRAGRAARWAAAVPTLRVCGMALAAWGLAVLLMMQPGPVEVEPAAEASKHLLVCLDSSPSMFVRDAGPDPLERVSRMVRAGHVLQAILDRLDARETRVTVFALYTDALPVVEETYDKDVVQHLFDGLPMYMAFEAGPTELVPGVAKALEYARRWPKQSALLVVVSDGDISGGARIRAIPQAIADSIVIGVGDPRRSTRVAGHASKQDTASLRALAGQLRGLYHEGNRRHLPSRALAQLRVIKPRLEDAIGLRDAAVGALSVGSAILGVLGPLLAAFGTGPDHPRRKRSEN